MAKETNPSQLDSYIVHHSGGGQMHVFAADEMDAVEKFYDALTSVLGHQMKICRCFGEPQPIDREKVVKPIKVDRVAQKS